MSRFGQAVVKVVGDESDAVASLKRLNASADAAQKQFDKDFGNIARSARNAGLAITAMGAAAVYGASQAVKAAAEAERGWARLGAVLRVNAGAVGRDFEQVRGLIEELRGSTFHNRPELEQSVSQLLTYKNIAGSTFERTIRLATDLSSVFGSLQQSTSALAKALDDPIRGLGDLRKQGFTFTAEVEGQIRALMAQNRLFDAQRLILSQLEKEVGGVAREMKTGLAGAIDDTAKAWENLKIAFGGAIVGEKAGDSVNALAREVEALAQTVERNKPMLQMLSDLLVVAPRAVTGGIARTLMPRALVDATVRAQQGAADERAHISGMRGEVEERLFGEARRREDAFREQQAQEQLDAEARRTAAADATKRAAEEAQKHWDRAQAILAEMAWQQKYSFQHQVQDPRNVIDPITGQRIGGIDPLPPLMQPFAIQDPDSVRRLRLAEAERSQARAYDNRIVLERLDPARVASKAVEELNRAERAAERFGDVLVNAIMQGSGAARSLALAGGRELMGRGMNRIVGMATASERGRAAAAEALAKGATMKQATQAGGAASAAATAAGPAGIAMAAGGLGLMLATSLFGKRAEDTNYRAHLRALRDARKDEVVINLHLPTGVIDTGNPQWREAIHDTIVDLSGSRVGRLNVMGN